MKTLRTRYADQVKYSRSEGPPLGGKLRKDPYSARDMAGMPGPCEGYIRGILARDKNGIVIVDSHKRVTKETFDKWYPGQTGYRVKEDREKDKEGERECIWLLDLLRGKADNVCGGRLPVHTRCFTEGANIDRIPTLEKPAATIRSRGMSVCPVLQAKSKQA